MTAKRVKYSLDHELRYISPENVAKDFSAPRERAAIAAVFRWLSLNGICAWEGKRPGTYSTLYRTPLEKNDAIVLSHEQYEHARLIFDASTVLVKPTKPRARRKKAP